ncbi:MAG: 50S ribosomal protein L17 [Candidatus Berkelbacteria bacterium Athens1014_28]|uniref:50S ribosomal protein L17 n=1 Tax=Candidatus Berkelbacteria bacterium Athens1014_28 TaxID=2017145 RepID=A0A554LR20_9BACT|nr:MAG: 50S ribosomal protein L17 [Candidatus Berkelbacteria bacterium Athens1014_28]
MTTKLGRKIGHRRSLLRNLATSLVLYEKVDTTLAKAKAVKPIIDRMITLSKSNSLSSYRHNLSFFFDINVSKKIRDELTKRYEKRMSGFTKIYHTGNRLGDNAKMARIELVDRKVFSLKPQKTTADDKEKEIKKTPLEKISKKFNKFEDQAKTEIKKGVVTKIRTNTRQKIGDK